MARKTTLVYLLLLTYSMVATAETKLMGITWQDSATTEVGANVVRESASRVRIEMDEASPSQQLLITLTPPTIESAYYALQGKIKTQDVTSDGYLELLSHFPEGGTFFSRTLGNEGPMKKLSGTEPWREFSLPFYRNTQMSMTQVEITPPNKLTLNVILPQGGVIWLDSVALFEGPHVNQVTLAPHAWLSEQQANLMGSYLGMILGVLGGLIGVLSWKGIGRTPVILVMKALVVVGTILLTTGMIALIQPQPYHVYFPLLLSGIILLPVIGFNIRNVSQRYEEKELRKMRAMDMS